MREEPVRASAGMSGTLCGSVPNVERPPARVHEKEGARRKSRGHERASAGMSGASRGWRTGADGVTHSGSVVTSPRAQLRPVPLCPGRVAASAPGVQRCSSSASVCLTRPLAIAWKSTVAFVTVLVSPLRLRAKVNGWRRVRAMGMAVPVCPVRSRVQVRASSVDVEEVAFDEPRGGDGSCRAQCSAAR